MILDELLKVMNSDYKVFSNGKEIEKADTLGEKEFFVESISAMEGAICIQVKECFSAPNDLNEEWVKEHVEKYGTLPNIFDGC